ncbi:MAG: 2-oxoacid:acceptor oxidoreductase family protein [Clostridia bacterium]|nr:2-oxoacid:acceptor oxidoreductase family protein [Clostridia bacterium]MBR3975328.1 2-oxoacid:acceptor oxidoreductase family protein [Clostridia bacterium]
MKKSLVVSGSGGQGVMSSGIMVAQTAVAAGKCATYLPEYGPEQRGGSAKCTVVVNDTEIISPLASKCDTLITMNEQSYKKFGASLKAGGVLIANTSRVISPITREDIVVVAVPADDIAVELGNIKCANIVLIGALIGADAGIITEEAMLNSLTAKFGSKKQEVLDLNKAALAKGIEFGKAAIAK